MENINNDNSDQQRVDENTGGPLEGMSPQNNNMPLDNDEQDAVVYAGLGVNNDPDIMNPGNEEATDTLLYTDTMTAHHATDEVSNNEGYNEFVTDLANDDLSDDEIDEQITELAEEEDEGNERY